MKRCMNEAYARGPVYPFAAVLGQEKIKNALIWNLVNPGISGVLISGEKGTAKSTLVRGAALLTDDKRIVEVPLNITEDRLVGSIDLRAALLNGKRELEPGLLKAADENILYVDEVNLLSDHIVNALLEAAASGRNVVEREGVSVCHPARFLLIGSMNPEEGKLRPQFLDRFGLYVEAEGEKDAETRMEIMKRRLNFERDPAAFCAKYAEDTELLRTRIQKAAAFLPRVAVTKNALQLAASLAADAFCAGQRGEMIVIQTARAIAALDMRTTLNISDIRTAAEYALPHRARNADAPSPQQRERQDDPNPPDQDTQEPEPDAQNTPESQTEPETSALESQKAEQADGVDCPPEDIDNSDAQEQNPAQTENPSQGEGQAQDDVQDPGETFTIPQWQDAALPRMINRGNGRRNRVRSSTRQGRYVAYRLAGEGRVDDLAFDATVRAAAPFQSLRDKKGRAIAIENDDLRIRIREKRAGGCILFVVDASASMGANKRMKEVKAAILSMLNVSYQKRDRVGFIAFRKDEAELLLGFTRSVELAQKQLEILPTGGRTPLAKGLELAYEVVMGLRMRDPEALPTIVLVSDGRASSAEKGKNPFDDALRVAEKIGNQKINTIILDTENDFIRFHLCERLNEKLNGVLVSMEELRSEGIVQVIASLKTQK